MNLVGGLEHFFHINIGNNHPNRLSYLLAELKPPTSEPFNTREPSLESTEVKRYVPHSGHPELKLCGALVFLRRPGPSGQQVLSLDTKITKITDWICKIQTLCWKSKSSVYIQWNPCFWSFLETLAIFLPACSPGIRQVMDKWACQNIPRNPRMQQLPLRFFTFSFFCGIMVSWGVSVWFFSWQ